MYYDGLTIPHITEKISELDKTLQREINLAKNIQSTLLNGETPKFEGGEVIGTSVPARLIGGDYYDFYPLMNGKIRIVIGDVMGKGIPAAMLMILTRGAFRSAAESTQGPGETLVAMNNAIYKDLRKLRSFVTLFCADWDPKTRIMAYANAGHNLPLHMSGKSGKVSKLSNTSGIMVGGLPDQNYEEGAILLDEGDTVFFYTDGIVEAQNENGEQYQIERLIDELKEHQDKAAGVLEKCVMESINQFTKDVPQKDDITMVILKVNAKESNITSFNSPVLC